MFLAGKTALVTGGGRGIGRAIAQRLARDGAKVAVTGRTKTEIEEVARAIGGVAVPIDMADRASLQRGLSAVLERAGHIDVLVNNAGIAESVPYHKTPDELWDRTLEVNVTSAFFLCRALIPPMIAKGFGRVVNIASNAGLTGYAYACAYSASKHALIGLTRTIALEIALSPVTINAVCPGWVRTRMAEEAVDRIHNKTGRAADEARRMLEGMSPQKRMIEPEEVAHVVAMLAAPEARGIHGQAIAVDGGQVMS